MGTAQHKSTFKYLNTICLASYHGTAYCLGMTTAAKRAGTWTTTVYGDPLWIPEGSTKCLGCGGDGRVHDQCPCDSAECPECEGLGYVAQEANAEEDDGDSEPLLQASVALARAGVRRFGTRRSVP